ncbi:4Fe-4S dicluster domain-containing protein [Thermodesulfovibrio yellowstonii]|uniref:4Fe-4S dicluster domain-containing protein n=1 Tax=Thermodesulfovibrio yellowstonii TaxID=28262 RepID=UPI0024B3BD21|nr:4Fe-4S dicluster domain-containing protein [Thermodesulfovibrio yellowstonii]MDI6864315.1 4Fe-4S binding protein [Thermodesulfovibrio yellowstonii]
MPVLVKDANKCVGCLICMFACGRVHLAVGVESSCIKVRSQGGISRGFTVFVCRGCEDPPCARACPEDALIVRKNGGVLLNEAKCTGCGYCVKACILDAIGWNSNTNKPVICIQCGECAKSCPYKVMEFKRL